VTQEIRLINASDSITDLTHLIRRAYKALADIGFNYTGAYQDEAVTLQRIKESECYVLVEDGVLVGTITLHLRSRYHTGKNIWYARPDVAVCGQFAVEPTRQRQGLGSKLMDCVERRAVELGVRELALDTAERAEHLVRFYTKRNYRFIDFIQHEGKTYRSVILSKAL
jgi:GNAT superfamily N-acetyltransferase